MHNQRTLGRSFLVTSFLMAAALISAAQTPQDPALQNILNAMDKAGANFRSAQAAFIWNQYQKVVDETDTQTGKIYFRRSGSGLEMAADVNEPDKKYVLFTGNKIQLYVPKIDQVTVYNTGKNRAEFESFLVLGFGGGGHDLLKSFDVKYLGTEVVGAVNAAKLDLVPKSQKVRNTFQHIVLWIDPGRGISLQQQFFDVSGDFRLAKYSDIELNQKIADSVFKLKTTDKTKIVMPQG